MDPTIVGIIGVFLFFLLLAVGLGVIPFGELHGGRGDPERVMFDSLTACTFPRPALRQVFGGTASWGIEMLNAACGWDLTLEDWNELVQRTVMMERCYSIREGHVPTRDDMLPARFFEEVIYNKYGDTRILNRDEFVAEREKWYLGVGLGKDGLPKKEELQLLGLQFVIAELEKLGLGL